MIEFLLALFLTLGGIGYGIQDALQHSNSPDVNAAARTTAMERLFASQPGE